MITAIHRQIIKGAPTCWLWDYYIGLDAWRFRLWPSIYITSEEIRSREPRFERTLKYKALAWARDIAAKIYVKVITDLMPYSFLDRSQFKEIALYELSLVSSVAFARATYRKTETDILAESLTRRFDVGSALNEATNRAIEAKKAAREEISELSGSQNKALEFQKQYLARILAKA